MLNGAHGGVWRSLRSTGIWLQELWICLSSSSSSQLSTGLQKRSFLLRFSEQNFLSISPSAHARYKTRFDTPSQYFTILSRFCWLYKLHWINCWDYVTSVHSEHGNITEFTGKNVWGRSLILRRQPSSDSPPWKPQILQSQIELRLLSAFACQQMRINASSGKRSRLGHENDQTNTQYGGMKWGVGGNEHWSGEKRRKDERTASSTSSSNTHTPLPSGVKRLCYWQPRTTASCSGPMPQPVSEFRDHNGHDRVNNNLVSFDVCFFLRNKIMST